MKGPHLHRLAVPQCTMAQWWTITLRLRRGRSAAGGRVELGSHGERNSRNAAHRTAEMQLFRRVQEA